MKANDLREKYTLQEGIWQNVKSAVKGFKSGWSDPNNSEATPDLGDSDREFQIFSQNLTQRAMQSIYTGVKSGMIDVTAAPEPQQPATPQQPAESTYNKLNAVFEDIIKEADVPATPGKETISTYLSKWITKYTKGMHMGDFGRDPQIQPLIKNVEETWSKDYGKAALQKIASTIWAKAQAGGLEHTHSETPNVSLRNIKATLPTANRKLLKQLQAAVNAELIKRGDA